MGVGCTVVGTVVAFEDVVLYMSEQYVQVCYSCNKLLPLCYEGVHSLHFYAIAVLDDFPILVLR